ncbi:unnamed protein product [Caenorhabditis angaria]|uniref:Uncharacterized protein n=1 Tax=Caenorhabditis angaria TaxID=860376 RepID=A0A9P1N2R2_9PELO|nr:unnamed protein product [Caenorhabditis angaria]
MVFIAPTIESVAPVNCELQLESGRNIQYIAARNANPRGHVGDQLPIIRKSSFHPIINDWESVNTLCHAIDNIVEIEMETDFFYNKSVLEIGFSTGLPSVYAFENGANEIAIYTNDNTNTELYCKPTLRRNNIPNNKTKVSAGTIQDLRKFLGGKKFDVILAPDLLNRSQAEFDLVHDLIEEAMANDGICLLSSLTYYHHVDGSLDAFLDLVKRRRQFDALEKWSSSKHDIIQQKVVQLTRSLF